MTTTEKTLCPRCKEDLSSYLAMKPDLGFCLFCQFPLMPVAGKYRLLEVLGEGGFGMVYRAMHLTMHRDAERVVKIMKPEVMEQLGMKDRFLREVQTTSALSQRNPHIVRVFDDFGEIPRLGYFYVMEFLKGVPLTDCLADRSQLPPISWCLDVFAQLCDAMQAAHEEQIVHRDLKPDNIFLIHHRRRDNFVKVLDFGIAKPLDSATSTGGHKTQGLLGTPFYVAPEQISNAANLDHRADIYAMGIILHELLTGQIPLVDPKTIKELTLLQLISMRMMSDKIPPLRTIRPDRGIPEGLDLAVQRALSRDPQQRFPSAEAFWAALEPFQSDLEGYTLQKPARIAGLTAASDSTRQTPPKHAIALDHTGQMDLNTPRTTPAIHTDEHDKHPPIPASFGPLPTSTEADLDAIDEETMAIIPNAPSSAQRSALSPPPQHTAALSSPSSSAALFSSPPAASLSSPSSSSPNKATFGDRPSSARSATLDQGSRPITIATPPSPQTMRSPSSRATLGDSDAVESLSPKNRSLGLFAGSALFFVAAIGIAYAMGLFSSPPPRSNEPITAALADAGTARWVPFPDMEVRLPEEKSAPSTERAPESLPEAASPEPQPEPAPSTAPPKPRQKRMRRKPSRRLPKQPPDPPTPTPPPPPPRKVSPCPDGIWMVVSPRVRLSDILLSGNQKATKAADGKGFCLPKGIKKASLSHPGFHECQFNVPQKSPFRVRMREQSDDVVEMDYCLSK